MNARLITVFLLALVVGACGKSSPAAPTPVAPAAPATPTVSALRIDGLDAVRTNFFSDYTATATLSNGTTQTVTPTWSSSNSSIASVDSTGRLTGISHGSVGLIATHQGASATKGVSIVTNFGGQWSGRFIVRACDQSGVFVTIRYCDGGVGATGPISLSLTQSGNDRTQLSGTVTFSGALTGNVTGNVTSDARMVIGSNFTITSSGVTFTFRIGGWDTRLSGPSSMTGKWADNLAAIGVAGNAYTENELQTMTRTSVAEVPSSAPQALVMEWAEFLSSMRRPQ